MTNHTKKRGLSSNYLFSYSPPLLYRIDAKIWVIENIEKNLENVEKNLETVEKNIV